MDHEQMARRFIDEDWFPMGAVHADVVEWLLENADDPHQLTMLDYDKVYAEVDAFIDVIWQRFADEED